MAIFKASTWEDVFCCDSAALKCGRSEATNHSWCRPYVRFLFASRIVHFSLWSNYQGVSPGCITISLNPTIDSASDLGLPNSLFSAFWMSATAACRLSFEYLIYQVSARSCGTLTNVTFFIWSFVTPWASHTSLTTNHNWSGSSFLKPLNKGNFNVFAILNCGEGVGGTSDGGEVGDGVSGGGIHGNPCLINWIALRGETFAISSSSPRGGEINGIYSRPFFPSFA